MGIHRCLLLKICDEKYICMSEKYYDKTQIKTRKHINETNET